VTALRPGPRRPAKRFRRNGEPAGGNRRGHLEAELRELIAEPVPRVANKGRARLYELEAMAGRVPVLPVGDFRVGWDM
jgi:hypothetical protein